MMREFIDRLGRLRQEWRELEQRVPRDKREVGFAKETVLSIGELLDQLIQEKPEQSIPEALISK